MQSTEILLLLPPKNELKGENRVKKNVRFPALPATPKRKGLILSSSRLSLVF